MTDQEMIEFVKGKLLEQGCQSVNAYRSCRYRGPNGTKCAAGWLIDDAYYHPNLERRAATGVGVRRSLLASGVKAEQIDLVKMMQNIHDGFLNERSWSDYINEKFDELNHNWVSQNQ